MINLFVISSSLEKLKALELRSKKFVEKIISARSGINFCGYFNDKEVVTDFSKSNKIYKPSIIINTSGGTEDLILAITELCKSPVLIFADPNKNSFASSLESFAYLKETYPIKLFYSKSENEKIEEAEKFLKAAKTISKIYKSKFGLIGEPSDWLLTSRDFNGFGNFKTIIKNIKVDEVVSQVSNISESEVEKIITDWEANYKEILVDEKSLTDSAKVYCALKSIIHKYQLNSLSIRCFDLLEYNYTACMALSMLNDEGIVSGCEGDLPTTFSMMIASSLCEEVVWMANPSSIDKLKNEIIFAHCTVPSKFLSDKKNAGLTTHMESEKSTAIRGALYKNNVTILRVGSHFNKIVAVTGKIIDSDMQRKSLCRTQAIVKIDGSVEKWIDESLGNHQVIAYGNILSELKYFCENSGIELVII